MATELTGQTAPAARPPPAARPTRSPRRLLWRALQLLGLLACGLFVWGLVAANAPFPESPELRGVRLDLPATRAVNKPLVDLLSRRGIYGGTPEALKEARDALNEGRWPERPLAVSAELERIDPPLDDLRAALSTPGCLPLARLDNVGRVNYFGLFQGVRALAIAAVSAAQQGHAARAADTLLPLLARLAELERCPTNLVGAMVLSAAIGAAHDAVGFLLADPRLDEQRVRALLARSAALARRPGPMPAAMRAEAAFRRDAIRSIGSDETPGEVGDRRGRYTPQAWPWYDEAETLAMSDQLGRRHVWIAERDPASPDWMQLSPEEAYFARAREQPAALSLLRFNALGIQTLAMLAPLHRPQLLRWHKGRCVIAARRARWLADLRRRGRALPAVAAVPARDPFTRRVFDPATMRSFCGAPAPDGESSPDDGDEIFPLPPRPAIEAP